MHKFLNQIVLFSVLVLTFFACSKLEDLEEAEYGTRTAEYAIPVLHTTTTPAELLENFDSSAQVVLLEDGSIEFRYEGEVRTQNTNDIFQTFRQYEGQPIPILDTVFFLPFNVPGQIDIDFGTLKSGTVQWVGQFEYDEPIELTIELPNIIEKNGEVFRRTRVWPNVPGVERTLFFSGKEDISESTVVPERDSFVINYHVWLTQSERWDTLYSLGLIIEDFDVQYAEGYLGTDLYALTPDTIDFGLLDEWLTADIYFADPRINILAQNSFGVPVRLIPNAIGILTQSGQQVPLRSNFIADGIDFNYPDIGEVGKIEETFFSFNTDNSNIDSLISSKPVALYYDLNAIPNPDQDTTIRGFLDCESEVSFQIEVLIPMEGRVSNISFADTIRPDFQDFDDAQAVEFKLVADNEIPIGIEVQAYFVNSDYEILDSLFLGDKLIVPAAIIDPISGMVVSPSNKITLAPVDEPRLSKMIDAEYIILSSIFHTANEPESNIVLLQDQQLDLRMGMKVLIEQ